MPLTSSILAVVGEVFQLKPLNGWGWVAYEDSRPRPFRFSDVAPTFKVRLLDTFRLKDDFYGGIAEVIEQNHPYSDHFIALFSFTDGYSDIFSKINSLQVKVFRKRPIIEPVEGVVAEKWVVNKQDVLLAGYVKILPLT